MASRRPQAGASHRLFVTVCPLDLWWMLPSVWVFALKHEERVQKAFSVDHHRPEDARLSHVLNPLSGPECDYVLRSVRVPRAVDAAPVRRRHLQLDANRANIVLHTAVAHL